MNGCRVEGLGKNAFLVKLLDLGYLFRSGQAVALWGGQYPPVPAFNHSKLESPHGLIVGKGCPTVLGSAGLRLTSTPAWVSHLIGSKGASPGQVPAPLLAGLALSLLCWYCRGAF